MASTAPSSQLRVRALHPLFAAEAVESSFQETPPEEVEAAMDRHAVLVFRGEDLTEDRQMALTRALGPIDMGLLKVLQRDSSAKNAGTIAISNVDAQGALIDRYDNRLMALYANQLWHSDSSFKRPSAKYSLLYAQVIPEKGGETEFADMRAAYDALSDDLRAALEGLVAKHSAFYSRMQLGDTQYTPEDLAHYPTVAWPVVRRHPGSGRRSLFIGAHAMGIDGLPTPEARLLLSDLLEHSTRPEFIYRHVWRRGDLVIWDNRAVLHRGRPYDLSAERKLRRTTVEDAPEA